MNIEVNKSYRIKAGMHHHGFATGEIVRVIELGGNHACGVTNGVTNQVVLNSDLQPLVEVIPHPTDSMPKYIQQVGRGQRTETEGLPTWCDLVQHERHTLLGELVDAMIYSGKAVLEVQSLVEKFKTAGYVRSVIFPNAENQ